MTESNWKTLFNLIIVITLLAVGFFLGRKTVVEPETKIVTEYIKGDTIRDTVYCPQPYKVVEPADTLSIIKQCIKDGIYSELWPEKVVTEYVEVTKEDTTKIMKDWATKRLYSETLFNDDVNGRCVFNSEIQYNRMKVIGYEFTPITKTVTETKYVTKPFSPFVSLSYLTNPGEFVKNPTIQVGGGAFIKDKIGLQLIYQRGFVLDGDYIGGGIIWKF